MSRYLRSYIDTIHATPGGDAYHTWARILSLCLALSWTIATIIIYTLAPHSLAARWITARWIYGTLGVACLGCLVILTEKIHEDYNNIPNIKKEMNAHYTIIIAFIVPYYCTNHTVDRMIEHTMNISAWTAEIEALMTMIILASFIRAIPHTHKRIMPHIHTQYTNHQRVEYARHKRRISTRIITLYATFWHWHSCK